MSSKYFGNMVLELSIKFFDWAVAVLLVGLHFYIMSLTVCQIWAWYIVPGFQTGPITQPTVFGVYLMSTVFLYPWFIDKPIFVEDSLQKAVIFLGFPLQVLAMAWAGTFFM